LVYIGWLYAIEKQATVIELSSDELYCLWQNAAKPMLTDFKRWLTRMLLEAA